jgi:hypothetical protein
MNLPDLLAFGGMRRTQTSRRTRAHLQDRRIEIRNELDAWYVQLYKLFVTG